MIIPLSGKVSWKNPPFVTIAIIAVNCLVYFVIQADDARNQYAAYDYYLSSGLARIEVSAYIQEKGLDKKDPKLVGKDGKITLSRADLDRYGEEMFSDERFCSELDQGLVITPEHAEYDHWLGSEAHFKEKLSLVVSDRYGFKPGDSSVVTAFTHMFLHGSFGHLLGNMVFLWLVGCVLEMGCGRAVYLAIYFVGGLCAVGLFCALNLHSIRPLVGASGAISALIGAYLVLYWTRKIKVFYSLGVYFNYTMVPAIAILPFYIGNEILQYFLDSYGTVAYMAHVGGLLGGSALGYVDRIYMPKADAKVFDQDVPEKIPGLLEGAMRAMEKLDITRARSLLREVLALDPNHRAALTQLYNAEKLGGAGDAYTEASSLLMESLIKDPRQVRELQRLYREYRERAGQPRIRPDLLVRVGAAFIAGGLVDDAEGIVMVLHKEHGETKQLPRMMFALARACRDQGDTDRSLRLARLLLEGYPDSREAAAARELVQQQGAAGPS